MKAGFTLLEVLVVFAVIAVLVAIAIPASSRMNAYTARMKSISNLRQIGVAAHLYANDHDQQLPGQPSSSLGFPVLGTPEPVQDQWPTLFCAYLSPSDPRVFLDPSDHAAAKLPLPQVISNQQNNTGFIYNGFDDLGVQNQHLATIPLTRLDMPAETVLLGQKIPGAGAFYVNLLTGPLGNLLSVLNPKAYDGGSHYLFVDGSVRFIKLTDYSNTLWLVNKNLTLPSLPFGLGRRWAQGEPATSGTRVF